MSIDVPELNKNTHGGSCIDFISNRQVKGVTVVKIIQFCVVVMVAILDLHNKSKNYELKILWSSKCRISHQNHFSKLIGVLDMDTCDLGPW